MIEPGKAATVEVQVTDGVSLDQVSLFYQGEQDTLWHPAPLHLEGNIYVGITPDTLSPQFITMRLLAADASGNILDYRAEPAYHIGPYSNRLPRHRERSNLPTGTPSRSTPRPDGSFSTGQDPMMQIPGTDSYIMFASWVLGWAGVSTNRPGIRP